MKHRKLNNLTCQQANKTTYLNKQQNIVSNEIKSTSLQLIGIIHIENEREWNRPCDTANKTKNIHRIDIRMAENSSYETFIAGINHPIRRAQLSSRTDKSPPATREVFVIYEWHVKRTRTPLIKIGEGKLNVAVWWHDRSHHVVCCWWTGIHRS